MATSTFSFTTVVYRHDADPPWHFVTLPEDLSDEIADLTAARSHGFGSVPVSVTIGQTTWSTSLFPDVKAAAYVLPVKKQVRNAEGLEDGSEAKVSITLR